MSKKLFIFTFMRKYILVIALIATVAMTACGTGSTTTEKKDSTATKIDSTKHVDSTHVADTTAVK